MWLSKTQIYIFQWPGFTEDTETAIHVEIITKKMIFSLFAIPIHVTAAVAVTGKKLFFLFSEV